MNEQTFNVPRIDLDLIRAHARDITLYDLAQAVAIASGTFDLPKACTWHAIWDELKDPREYRITCSGGSIEVEVDGSVARTLTSGNSTDVRGSKIRVHAVLAEPAPAEGRAWGTFDRL